MSTQQFTDLTSIEVSATPSDQSATFKVNYIALISNDGTDDVVINFMGMDTSGPKSTTLKPGDSISDILIDCRVIHYRSKSGSQPIRVWGLTK